LAKEVALDVPPEIVALANVMLFNVVTVFPSWIAVLPSVIAVAKLLSSCDNGIDVVAFAKVFGTGILEPRS
jgi:hypothetical protein